MKFRVEGLRVEIQPPKGITLKKATLPLCKFRCRCDLETISIEDEDIKSIGSDAYHSDGTPMHRPWDLIKPAYEMTKEWNDIHRKAKDFLDYFKSIYQFRHKHRGRSMSHGGHASTLTVKCPTCERTYTFGVSIENPLDPIEELEPLEAYREWGLQDSEEFQRLLARWLNKEGWKHDPPLETSAQYMQYVNSLDGDTQFVTQLITAIEQAVKDFQPKTDRTKSWLQDLKDSLKELREDFAKESERLLKRELEFIADYLKPSGYEWRPAIER